MDIKTYLAEQKSKIDASLSHYLERDYSFPPRLAEAMRYSVMAGGKRVRAILTMATARAVGGREEDVLPCACAMEMIHTFSLIHDDLPAMDNDDLRRGVPTNHKVFGEAMAILSGDALLAEAFLCLVEMSDRVPGSVLLEVVRDIAEATGPRGMVGGQVLDMAAEGKALTGEEIRKIHQYKTGALIKISVTSGAKLVGANTDQIGALARYGESVGLAFQIADDLLGAEGICEELGKPVGSDAARKKATYQTAVGIETARKEMLQLTGRAVDSLQGFGELAEPLRLLAHYITERRN